MSPRRAVGGGFSCSPPRLRLRPHESPRSTEYRPHRCTPTPKYAPSLPSALVLRSSVQAPHYQTKNSFPLRLLPRHEPSPAPLHIATWAPINQTPAQQRQRHDRTPHVVCDSAGGGVGRCTKQHSATYLPPDACLELLPLCDVPLTREEVWCAPFSARSARCGGCGGCCGGGLLLLRLRAPTPHSRHPH